MNEIIYPPVREALSHLEVLYSDEELRLAAVRREQALVDAEDMLDQARYEGEQKGKLEGRLEGKAGTLADQLTHKFGILSLGIQERLTQATTEQLKIWSLNILDAKTLDEVFNR